MKKLLQRTLGAVALMATAMGIAPTASAEELALPETNKTWKSYTWTQAGDDYKATISNFEFFLQKGTSQTDLNVNVDDIRIYQGSQLTITAPDGYVMTKIEGTTASSSKATGAAVSSGWSVTTEPQTAANSPFVFTATTGQESITFNGTDGNNGKQMRVKTLKITYQTGTPAAVKAPTMEMVQQGEGFVVKMACATEGATIHYTMDGTDPTATSDTYTAPVEVWEKTTLKALAVKGTDVSSITTFVADPPMILDGFSAMSDFPDGTKVIVNCPMTVAYQNGKYLYVRDSSRKYMLIYGSLGKELTNGDTFNTLQGTYSIYSGLSELTNVTIGEVTTGGTPVEPIEQSLSMVAPFNMHAYLTIPDVTVAAWDGRNSSMTDADETTVALYNQFQLEGLVSGANCTVSGFVGMFNDNVQFYPTAITQGSTPSPTLGELTVTLPDGTVAEEDGSYEMTVGQSVKFAAENAEKITILGEDSNMDYAIDVEANAAEYTWTADKAYGEVTVVAHATLGTNEKSITFTLNVKEGTVVDPTAKSVTFDFTKSNYGLTVPESGNGTDLCAKGESKVCTEGDINMTVACAADAQTAPRLWTNKNGTDLRAYAGTTITISSAVPGIKIKDVVFTQNSGNTDWGTNTYNPNTFVKDGLKWNVGSTPVAEFVMTVAAKTYVATATVNYVVESGIAGVEADKNAPVQYYNLQGVRVEKPAKGGIYIRVQGGKSVKIAF